MPTNPDPTTSTCLTSDCVELASDIMRSVDTTVNPCDDFFQYACGNWNVRNPIPDDKARWGAFSVLNQQNQQVLRTVLETPAAPRDPSDAVQKARNFYTACLDTATIDSLGAAPVRPLLQSLNFSVVENGAWTSSELTALTNAIVTLHSINVDVLFGFGVGQDDKNSSLTAIFVMQGGLGLPSREYYFKDRTTDKVLVAYLKHMSALFNLVGIHDDTLPNRVLDFETSIATISVSLDSLRDPEAVYNPKTVDQMTQLISSVNWMQFFTETLLPQQTVDHVIVNAPVFFSGLQSVLVNTAAAFNKYTVIEYLQWHALLSLADHLSQDFRNEDATFNGALVGVSTLPPRWQTCVSRTDGALGFVLGKMFIDREFSGDSKTIAEEMLARIKTAFESNLPNLAWMDDATRAKAIEKADYVVQKIGYPDWINDATALNAYYALLKPIQINGYFDGIMSVRQFDVQSNIAEYGKPVDRSRWGMSPPTVNAYYNPANNEIVFPAGIMQAPFFDKNYPKSFNYGAMGVVMGHELTHGFDDQGSQYDKYGDLEPWWAPSSVARFQEATKCVADQYSGYIVNGEHVNGNLTLGENIADNGGLKEAYNGYQAWVRDNGAEPGLPGLSHTAEQLFFLGFAQVWCGAYRPQEQHRLLLIDPHSPPRFRVIGAVSNSNEFAQAYQCPSGSAMNPTKKCTVW